MQKINTRPQVHCFKTVCRFLYLYGIGNCWHEDPENSPSVKILYKMWCAVSNFYIFWGVLNQLLAFSLPNLTVKEQNTLVQVSLGQLTVLAKLIVLYLQKNRIRMLFRKFWEGDKWFSSLELEEASVKKAVRYCIAVASMVYLTLSSLLIDGIQAYFRQGIPIQSEVTFFPTSREGIISKFVWVINELHLWYAITLMTLIDCVSICCLIFVGFKFKMLQVYFDEMRENFLKNIEGKSKENLEKDYEERLVIGIKLHENTLWCASNVQYALGNIYSIQVVESIFLIVMCLIKLVSGERNLTFLLANLIFIVCLVVLTGVYMMAGGDVTYEAAQVPNAIFYSGWELNRARKNLRILAVVSIMRGQVPVLMTAFGIISLSYTNFIYVIRHSYSFFAVMY